MVSKTSILISSGGGEDSELRQIVEWLAEMAGKEETIKTKWWINSSWKAPESESLHCSKSSHCYNSLQKKHPSNHCRQGWRLSISDKPSARRAYFDREAVRVSLGVETGLALLPEIIVLRYSLFCSVVLSSLFAINLHHALKLLYYYCWQRRHLKPYWYWYCKPSIFLVIDMGSEAK